MPSSSLEMEPAPPVHNPDMHLGDVIRLTPSATVTPGPEVTQAAREAMARFNAVALSNTITPDLAAMLKRSDEKANFVEEVIDRIGQRRIDKTSLSGNILRMVLGRNAMLQWAQDVAGCGKLGRVMGNIAEIPPGSGHELGWHKDFDRGARPLAIVVNLSPKPYQGGEFQLREVGMEEPMLRYTHSHYGSALIFRVADHLQHRVLKVEGAESRTVFAGWFVREGS